MKKIKNVTEPIDFFTLDLSDAILPKAWPADVPLILKLQTGQHEKKYDIMVSDEPWYKSLLKYVHKNQHTSKNQNLPIGINDNLIPIGGKVYDSEKNMVAQGKDKKSHLQELAQQKHDLEQKLIPLRAQFAGIKDEYLIEFNETQQMLRKRKVEGLEDACNTLTDILQAGGGSTYRDGTLASLGAYNSLLDFEVLKTTIGLFDNNEVKLLQQAFSDLEYLSPIYKMISSELKTSTRPKMK